MSIRQFGLFVSLLIVIVLQEVRLFMVERKYCVSHREIVVSPAFYPTTGGSNCRDCHEQSVRNQTHEIVKHMPSVSRPEVAVKSFDY
jgi:hypothetical protein